MWNGEVVNVNEVIQNREEMKFQVAVRRSWSYYWILKQQCWLDTKMGDTSVISQREEVGGCNKVVPEL